LVGETKKKNVYLQALKRTDLIPNLAHNQKLSNAMIRLAEEKDMFEMLEIYRPFVEKTAITFELKTPSLSEFTKRINKAMRDAPCLVCEVEGEVLGYAMASEYRSKGAYAWTRELTVYIHNDFKTKKIGTALYLSLIELLKLQNYRHLLAGITLPNIPSVSFHERIGFLPVGVFDNVGVKFGKMQRVGWWQMSIQDPYEPAREIVSYRTILATQEGKKALARGESRVLV